MARHQLTAALGSIVRPSLLADAAAIAAELVGNAVHHAAPLPGGVIKVAWRIVDGGIEIRVSDGGAHDSPQVRSAAPDAISGRGLTIVQALASRWGYEPEGTGQCVWAELN